MNVNTQEMILVECQRRYEFMILPQKNVWKENNA
jgi:hypothetical protein